MAMMTSSKSREHLSGRRQEGLKLASYPRNRKILYDTELSFQRALVKAISFVGYSSR